MWILDTAVFIGKRGQRQRVAEVLRDRPEGISLLDRCASRDVTAAAYAPRKDAPEKGDRKGEGTQTWRAGGYTRWWNEAAYGAR